jgi:hypothetical protein
MIICFCSRSHEIGWIPVRILTPSSGSACDTAIEGNINRQRIDELSAALQKLDAELRARDRIIATPQSALKVDHPA